MHKAEGLLLEQTHAQKNTSFSVGGFQGFVMGQADEEELLRAVGNLGKAGRFAASIALLDTALASDSEATERLKTQRLICNTLLYNQQQKWLKVSHRLILQVAAFHHFS